jgi:hypothetical protein
VAFPTKIHALLESPSKFTVRDTIGSIALVLQHIGIRTPTAKTVRPYFLNGCQTMIMNRSREIRNVDKIEDSIDNIRKKLAD